MILDLVYPYRDLNISNQVTSRSTYLLIGLSATNLYTKDLCHLVNTLIFTEFIIRLMALTKLTFILKKSSNCV